MPAPVPRSFAHVVAAVAVAGCATPGATGPASPVAASLALSSTVVARYDFVEATLALPAAVVANPFTDVAVTAVVAAPGEAPRRIEGFCDDPAGRLFRVRFMPARIGPHLLSMTVAWARGARSGAARFDVRDAGRRGVVRVDREHPFHFVWDGTGQHYFWNGTTAYGVAGWDDATLVAIFDRFRRLRVNRVRATLLWRARDGLGWFEPVSPTTKYSMVFDPWPAARPGDVADPGFDVTRFNVQHFRQFERVLRLARERDIVVSVIPYTDGARPGTDPFGRERMGQEDERRYYRYLVARFAAFSNVMWDVTNEYHLFRDEPWVEQMGAAIADWDPYRHPISVHGHARFPFRRSRWADFAMHQSWDEAGGHAFMLENRRAQERTGRPMPQVNEEYGYEDHYPVGWGGDRRPPSRSADNRRRIAWEISMAGGYQTTGERADRGTGHAPDTGGGWINGRGDDTMKLLELHGHMMDFFTSFDWWRAEPRA